MERESMEYDVGIVGAGPAGLSASIRLKQLNPELSVCVLEKGSEVGAHILSGAVFEPTALNELLPNWKELNAPLDTAVTNDDILWLSNSRKSNKIPAFFAPKTMHNTGNYIISLANLCRWLAEQAEALEVEIFPGFTGYSPFIEDGVVKGVITGDMGRASDNSEKDGFTAGMALLGKQTLFCEGCRGSIGKELIQTFALDTGKDPQHYGLGIKELWKIPADQHELGKVIHTSGWPLSETQTGGGGFAYFLEDNLFSLGLITDLSYQNPYLSPYSEFQRFKIHPAIAGFLAGGERIAYGARAIAKGGLQSQPKMVFPGGMILGDNAGTLNAAKIKGSHTAMKSGMIAAESIVEEMNKHDVSGQCIDAFEINYKSSWAYKELHCSRNFSPALHKFGAFLGGAYAFFDINLFNGHLPWTLRDKQADHDTLMETKNSKPIDYPKPDGVLTFDRLSSVFISNTNHEEDQPCHLVLRDQTIPIQHNLPKFNEPAQRYCPAGVYEVVETNGSNQFQINAQNCVHCKTCDIKDPSQNIRWVPPEGGGGPNYPNM